MCQEIAAWFWNFRGTKSQVDSTLTYLEELDIEIFHQSTPEEERCPYKWLKYES
jgi:hypothetical protein